MQQHLRKVSSLIPGQTQYLLDCTCKSYVTVWSIVLKPQTALWGVNVRSSDTCHVISQNSSATTSWRQVLQTCQIWQHFVVWYWKCLWNLLHFRTNNQTDWFWAPLLKLPCKWAQRKVNRSIKKNDLHDWETFLASLWTWKAPKQWSLTGRYKVRTGTVMTKHCVNSPWGLEWLSGRLPRRIAGSAAPHQALGC